MDAEQVDVALGKGRRIAAAVVGLASVGLLLLPAAIGIAMVDLPRELVVPLAAIGIALLVAKLAAMGYGVVRSVRHHDLIKS